MSLAKLNVKKGDTVLVLSGKDKGKQGKVIVEGVNKVKRHTKPSQIAPQGGIITKEAPLFASKVQLVCPACGKATRIAHRFVDGRKIRACKKCGEAIEQ